MLVQVPRGWFGSGAVMSGSFVAGAFLAFFAALFSNFGTNLMKSCHLSIERTPVARRKVCNLSRLHHLATSAISATSAASPAPPRPTTSPQLAVLQISQVVAGL